MPTIQSMNIGFLTSQTDARCILSPTTLKKYEKDGFSVRVEKGLGEKIGVSFAEIEVDQQTVVQQSDIICTVSPPDAVNYKSAQKDAIFISFYQPYMPEFSGEGYSGEDVSIFSLDMIPRSTLAQSMDALSAMASIGGYKAVLLAAQKLPRLFPMMMTASGAIRPANVLVLGAGVAGLQAIATARKLGARVEAFDVRSAVREEVKSLGAKFVEVEGAVEDKAAGGYAVEQTDDFKRKQKEAIAASVKKADVVITTAQIRGRKAPILVTEEMIKAMSPGSVIVDMASSTGGNCELIEDKMEVVKHGVLLIGDSELYLRALNDASDLLANIYYNFISLLKQDGEIKIDHEHPILSSALIYPKK